MATTKTTNPSGDGKSVKQGQRKVAKRDNPYQTYFDIMKFCRFMGLLLSVRYETGVEEAGLQVLSMICDKYLIDGKGMTVFAISAGLSPQGIGRSALTNTRRKCKRLRDVGWIEEAGVGRYSSAVYIPSRKALDKLKSICAEV